MTVPTITEPVVAVAFRSMTPLLKGAKPEVTLDDYRDVATTKEMLLKLRRNGHELNTDEIVAWASANGWRADAVAKLAKWLKALRAGKQIRPGVPGRLRDDIVDTWRAEAGYEEPLPDPRRYSRDWGTADTT